VSITEPIGDDTMGNLMDSMLAAFAQFDNKIRISRTTGGMITRLEQGGWPLLPMATGDQKHLVVLLRLNRVMTPQRSVY
jgi:DNA invertase Pin-like site-specific DNA recombinase